MWVQILPLPFYRLYTNEFKIYLETVYCLRRGRLGISSFCFVLFWCGGFGSLRLLVFLLNYCWGGGFKNFKLLEKIQKHFAVFAEAETLLHSVERAAAGIGLYVNAHKTEYMCYNQTGDISTLDGTPLKLVDKFTYLGSSVASTEKDIDTRLTKAWTAINRKSDLTDKMKRSFFQAAVASILLYGCTTWTLTKRLEKKLDGNYTRMLQAILNKSLRQHLTRHQLYDLLPRITKTI